MSSVRTAALILVALLVVPSAMAGPPKISSALLTFYWMADEHAPRYRGEPVAELCDVHGKVIATTSRAFRRAVVCEGTGRLRDGRVVVYARRVHGEHRFRVAKRAITSSGHGLVPFRTVAVDPRIIKVGSRIFIPELKGARLSDGTTHDGMFVATDCGHFRGKHVDVFVGDGPEGVRPFARRGYGSRSRVTVYVVK